MKAFVTGGTGLLGSNLVRGLLAEGHEVKALARSADKAQRILGDLDVEFISGDMRDVAGFANQLAGCDVLFHVAAYFREYYQPGEHVDLLHEINVSGTLNLLRAALDQQVNNVVYVSSGGVLDGSAAEGPVDESASYHSATSNLYFRSKIEAEKAVFDFIKNKNLRVISILPGVMFGPGDSGPTTLGQSIIDFLNRRVPGIMPGGLWLVDARDVADSMIKAIHAGAGGERYLIAGRYFEIRSFMKSLEKASGVPAPGLHIPYPFAVVYAWFSELGSRITGNPPQLTRQAVRILQDKNTYSSEKAMKELGTRFRPLEETLRDQVEWNRANGYISK